MLRSDEAVSINARPLRRYTAAMTLSQLTLLIHADNAVPASAMAPAWPRIFGRRAFEQAALLTHPLLDLFTLPHATPLAPLRYLGDGGAADDAVWLCAEPVHLQIRGDRVALTNSAPLTLAATELADFTAIVRELFSAEAARVECVNGRIYVGLARIDDVRFTSLSAAASADVQPFLPNGPAGALWRRRLNESQMLLHDAPLNAVRSARGLPTVDSVWFWGAGYLATQVAAVFTHVWSDEPLSRGLALRAGSALASTPAALADWLAHIAAGHHLLVTSAAIDAADWAAIANALRTRALREVRLVTADGHEYRIGARHVRSWWQRWWPAQRGEL